MIHVLTYIVLVLMACVLVMQNRDIDRLEKITDLQNKQLKKMWIYLTNTSNNGVITARTLDKLINTQAEGKHAGEDRTSYEN